MKVQSLSFGVVIGRGYYKVILLDSGYFQLMEDNYIKHFKLGDYVFFAPNTNGKSNFVVSLRDFDYYENTSYEERDDYDPILYRDNGGIRIPKKILMKSNNFIVNTNSGSQLIVYYQEGEMVYAGSNYTHQEQVEINAFFQEKNNHENSFDVNKKLYEIDAYLDELNVDDIIDSFIIENKETFINRPGKDDYYYVHKVYKVIEEPYINRLFPNNTKCIYSDSGFCTAVSMSINPPKRPYVEEEALLKRNAKEKYNKDEHRRFLIERMMSDYRIDVIERNKNTNYIKNIFSRAICKLIGVDSAIHEVDYKYYLKHLCETYNFFMDSSKKLYKEYSGKYPQ